MDVFGLITSKPVLVGLHLGFAIVGIDALLWLLGEIVANTKEFIRHRMAAFIAVLGFLLSWMFGGYYYVVFYGTLVKPEIKAGVAPWVHSIVMETKEHIFLFVLPLALTTLFLTLLSKESFEKLRLKTVSLLLLLVNVGIAFLIGAMGFMISATARWGT
ncbi:MAG: hypothetical protein HYT50_01455 [Candidatus Wildermuthbacteria bacterium]|nr:hypothetical protein [Candidatus Wildermuthbacteria bacterium]